MGRGQRRTIPGRGSSRCGTEGCKSARRGVTWSTGSWAAHLGGGQGALGGWQS